MAIYSHSIAAAASSARCLTNCVNITHTHTQTHVRTVMCVSHAAKWQNWQRQRQPLYDSTWTCVCVCVCDVSKNLTQWKTKSAQSHTHRYALSLIESPKKEWKQQTKRDLCVCLCVCVWGSCRQMPPLTAPQMRCYHEFHVNPTYKAQKQLLLLFFRAATLTHTHTHALRGW